MADREATALLAGIHGGVMIFLETGGMEHPELPWPGQRTPGRPRSRPGDPSCLRSNAPLLLDWWDVDRLLRSPDMVVDDDISG